jgi:RNA polymerase sigma factor (sigma-70 family)
VDDTTFTERFEELYGAAYNVAYAILGERGDAEECAQEALARALLHWRRVETYAAPWVSRVSTNLALDRVRASRPRLGIPLADHDDVAVRQVERRRDLALALQALPRRQREAVVLRFVLGFPERDVADAMGCSLGTVKSTTSRGLSRLRTDLGPSWAWED